MAVDLLALPAHRIARSGIARTYQIPRPFAHLTVRDNVALAAMFGGAALDRHRANEAAAHWLQFTGLAARADAYPGDLNLHQVKFLELARGLAASPRLLLLDEVLSGLTPAEIDGAVDLIRRIRAQGTTIVLVEHVMRVVTALAERIVVLDQGRVLAEGRTADVMARPDVVAAYLGASPCLRCAASRWTTARRRRCRSVSLDLAAGEVVCILGPNGAGKSTLINALAGLHRASAGRIAMDGRDLTALPAHRYCSAGIAIVPEGRRLFTRMSVRENLEVGSYAPAARKARARTLERVCTMFPAVRDKLDAPAGALSGGQQQMVAIGRALMAQPRRAAARRAFARAVAADRAGDV